MANDKPQEIELKPGQISYAKLCRLRYLCMGIVEASGIANHPATIVTGGKEWSGDFTKRMRETVAEESRRVQEELLAEAREFMPDLTVETADIFCRPR